MGEEALGKGDGELACRGRKQEGGGEEGQNGGRDQRREKDRKEDRGARKGRSR